MRKLCDDERPLYLRLCAGPSEKVLSLVLKENETGDVNVSSYDKPASTKKNILYIQYCDFIALFNSGMHLAYLNCATFCASFSVRKRRMYGK